MSSENEFVCFFLFVCLFSRVFLLVYLFVKTRDSIVDASRTYTNFGNNADVSLAKRGPGNEVVAASSYVSCDVIST